MIFTVSNRSRVSKLPNGKWLSKNAQMPPKVFDTWAEAMEWANHRFLMMNGRGNPTSVVCEPCSG